MKIIITGYNTSNQNVAGGVQLRVKRIYRELSQRNDIIVDYFCPMTSDLHNCDILHIFKLEPEFLNLVLCAKKLGVKVVLSSIVNMIGGNVIWLKKHFLSKIPLLHSSKEVFNILELVDCIIAETYQEKVFLSKYYGVPNGKIVVIGNGIDRDDYHGNEIFDVIGTTDKYILQVGRMNENKNIHNVIKALKGLSLHYVCIGDGDHNNSEYVNRCKALAGEDLHFHFLGWVNSDSELLKSAYANAQVFVVSSYQETFSLVALEGAVHGCNMAMTKTLPIHDFHVFDDCWLFDPYDIDDIKDKIVSAYYTPRTDMTKQKVLKTFSCEKIIDEHIDVYKSLVK